MDRLEAASAGRVQLRDGRLHIPSAVYQSGLAGCPALALLVRDGRWLLLPLRAGAGGLQIKIRSACGDRVVEAQEFFRGLGFEDGHEPHDFALQPDPDRGGFELLPLAS